MDKACSGGSQKKKVEKVGTEIDRWVGGRKSFVDCAVQQVDNSTSPATSRYKRTGNRPGRVVFRGGDTEEEEVLAGRFA